MKITNQQLKRIIQEELESVLNEMPPVPVKSPLPGPLGVASDLARGIWWSILAHLEQTVPDGPEKEEMLDAVEKEAEKEESGPSGHEVSPNAPWRPTE